MLQKEIYNNIFNKKANIAYDKESMIIESTTYRTTYDILFDRWKKIFDKNKYDLAYKNAEDRDYGGGSSHYLYINYFLKNDEGMDIGCTFVFEYYQKIGGVMSRPIDLSIRIQNKDNDTWLRSSTLLVIEGINKFDDDGENVLDKNDLKSVDKFLSKALKAIKKDSKEKIEKLSIELEKLPVIKKVVIDKSKKDDSLPKMLKVFDELIDIFNKNLEVRNIFKKHDKNSMYKYYEFTSSIYLTNNLIKEVEFELTFPIIYSKYQFETKIYVKFIDINRYYETSSKSFEGNIAEIKKQCIDYCKSLVDNLQKSKTDDTALSESEIKSAIKSVFGRVVQWQNIDGDISADINNDYLMHEWISVSINKNKIVVHGDTEDHQERDKHYYEEGKPSELKNLLLKVKKQIEEDIKKSNRR